VADRKRTDELLFLDRLRERPELAGDHMRLEHQPEHTTITFDNVGTGRRCGSCTLCCRVVPVLSLEKDAGERCHYQTRKGCSIYQGRPYACRVWSCGWLADPEARDMPRPDHAGYVVDITPDYIILTDTETGQSRKVGAVQVWVDPLHPDAWRDERLRRYMVTVARLHGMPTIVRFSRDKAVTVFPPPMSRDGQWHERWDGKVEDRTEPPVWVSGITMGE